MNAEITHPKTLVQAVNHFADLDNAHAFFVKARWGNGPISCPRCGSAEIHYLANQRRWECKEQHPKRQFSVKVGSVMEDSPIGLDKWAVAVWLEANSKNSISSYEIHRALGITQKSAWFMLHRIRLALKAGSFEKMGGGGKAVEADETAIGGLAKNMHAARRRKAIKGRGVHGKAIVMGLLERHTGKKKSTVRAQIVQDVKRETLHAIIRKNVEPGSSIYTDALFGYRELGEDYFHAYVDHAERYVAGQVHCNGMENFWSLFKRCIKGTHVSVDPAHLLAYVDSEAFRFNNRDTNDGGRFKLAAPGMFGKRLTYKALTGALEQPPETSGPGPTQA